VNSRFAPTLIPNQPHRRFNPLSGEWILVSPHRTQRPWQGKVEAIPPVYGARYDPNCYLCPGNFRANGAVNPQYETVFAFENDFGALLPGTAPCAAGDHPLIRQEAIRGICRVLCFSPRHDLTLALMSAEEIRLVVDLWAAQDDELGRDYPWVQIFENRGDIMGCSNPHPHGQLWAGSTIPNEPLKEEVQQRRYRMEQGSVLLLDYLEFEGNQRARIVVENDSWVAMVPFWAVWPFETLLLPRRHVWQMSQLGPGERDLLAAILKRLLTRYDNLFQISFPYTMGWHGAPHGTGDPAHWQLHAHFYPPLLRSASVRKFMVGYEMLAEPQRDITPEAAAERLQSLPETHYTVDSRNRTP
jgi:UDPglucose--hexose-1-phosphate uridylyltransferase